MRQCFIHVGTHKTGTTSLQRALSRHQETLRSRRYLYPRTSRPPQAPDGHHNVALEISGDRRFRSEYGTLEDLIAEIQGARDHHILLSSEDLFSSDFQRRIEDALVATPP
jgi:hypothetical protein